jgi:WD40 repeat protein
MQNAVTEDLQWISKVMGYVKKATWLWVFLGCVAISRVCIYPMTPWGQWAQANYINEAWGGTVELVVPAERGVRLSDVSPDGKWLLWSGYNQAGDGQRFLTNLITGEEFNINFVRPGRMVWLPNDQILLHDWYDYWIEQLPTMEVAHEFQVIEEKKNIEELNVLFSPLENIYAFRNFSGSNSGIALVSFDSTTPLVYARGLGLIDITELSFPFTLVQEPWADDFSPHTSPNGKWVAYTEKTMLANLYVKDSITGEVVAYVEKSGRGVRLLGWSPDSKAFYFVYEVGGASGGILSPSEPVFKLVLDPALAP